MSTSEENSKKERKLGKIQRFFAITCSGSDKDIIEQYPTEWTKYTGIGIAIFFTGVFASLSGGYALYSIFRNTALETTIDVTALTFAILFGLLWGQVIFNLDRFIVSTFKKSNDKNRWKGFGKELLSASPRIVLSALIAISISKPIEIKIFENRLAEQIQRSELAARKRNVESFEIIHDISGRIQDVEARERRDSNLQERLNSDPLIVTNLIEDRNNAERELAEIRRVNQSEINSRNELIRNIRNNPNNYRPIRDAEGNIMFDDNGNVRQSLTQEANNLIANHNREIGRLRDQINTKQTGVNTIISRITQERENHRTQTQGEINQNREAQRIAEVRLDSAMVLVGAETETANVATRRAFSNNFITQLEALGDLTKILESDDEETRNRKRTMRLTSLVITFLILAVELAPIFTKLIMKRGPYDERLDCIEHEVEVEQKSIRSQINSEINEHLRRADEAATLSGDVMIKMKKDDLETKVASNKIIRERVAEIQRELALLALEKWREEELAKINSDNIRSSTI